MASDSEEIEYQALAADQYLPVRQQNPPGANDDDEDEDDSEISLHEEQGFLVHMSPDVNKSQWNHVDDLDKFFTSVYEYHQRHGFQNMVLAEIMQLLQFVFIVLFVTYLSWCVNYPELFDEIPHNTTHKKTFSDVTYPVGTCIAKFNFVTWLLLSLCLLVFVGRSIKMVVNFSNYLRTRNFFISALNTETRDLSNMTWHEVQLRLLEVQKEQQICIHKQELTQLDIYHRILRFKNYLVAMVNKDLLPLKFQIPLIGQHAVLTHGMRFNLDVLLYFYFAMPHGCAVIGCKSIPKKGSPWSIFVNSYTMRDEYKSHHKRKQLADQLSTHITVLALLNLVLCPFIFIYQIIYFFFRYAEYVKRSPSLLGSRQWANYGRLYLRHFNELDHELNARLNRAYVPSKMYMNSFTSPSLTVFAKYVAFFAGAPAAVLFALGILDFNDVTKVEHLFTVASVCGMLATVCSSLIPDENEVFCPERLMMSILAQIHYMPDQWKGKAHTSTVRDEFAMLFQYKIVYIIEELLSPLFTPFWLFFFLRKKSTEIVDFFRYFTVEVSGVGDVCSFAQMDIKRHGNPQWTGPTRTTRENITKAMQAEHGKTELSLMHFTTTNPEWKPPQESNMFIAGVKQEVNKDLPALTSIVADPISLPSLGYVNPVPPIFPMGGSIHCSSPLPHDLMNSQSPLGGPPPRLRGGLSNLDGPVGASSNLQSSMTNSSSFHTANFAMSMLDEGQRELLCGNMSLSVLHMHEAHHRSRRGEGGTYQFHIGDPHDHQETQFTSGGYRPYNVRQQPQYHHHQHQQQLRQTHLSGASGGVSPTSPTLSPTSLMGSVIQRHSGGGAPRPDQFTELSIFTQPASGKGLRPAAPHHPAHHDPVHTSDMSAGPSSLPHPLAHDMFDDDFDSSPGLTSLPPLDTPGQSYPLPPSTASSIPSGMVGTRSSSDAMPQIVEDATGEHELDTSTTPTAESR